MAKNNKKLTFPLALQGARAIILSKLNLKNYFMSRENAGPLAGLGEGMPV